jgi:hypothetical protein
VRHITLHSDIDTVVCLTTVSISLKKSDTSITNLSRYVSDCTALVSLRRGICISLIYHAMSLTTVSVSLRRVIQTYHSS